MPPKRSNSPLKNFRRSFLRYPTRSGRTRDTTSGDVRTPVPKAPVIRCRGARREITASRGTALSMHAVPFSAPIIAALPQYHGNAVQTHRPLGRGRSGPSVAHYADIGLSVPHRLRLGARQRLMIDAQRTCSTEGAAVRRRVRSLTGHQRPKILARDADIMRDMFESPAESSLRKTSASSPRVDQPRAEHAGNQRIDDGV